MIQMRHLAPYLVQVKLKHNRVYSKRSSMLYLSVSGILSGLYNMEYVHTRVLFKRAHDKLLTNLLYEILQMRNNSISSFLICLPSLWCKVRRLQMNAINFFLLFLLLPFEKICSEALPQEILWVFL